MRQVILVALVSRGIFQDNRETDFSKQVKDELVCANRVSNIEGKLKLAHLRVIIILIQYLQPALRHKITFRRISGAVPERLLPPKSEMALDGCHRIITVPVSEFCLGSRNGGRLRKYLEELQYCHLCVSSARGENVCKPLIAGFDYPQFSRTVDIHMSEPVIQALLSTEEGYFTFSKSQAFSISNRYTLRIYWLVSSWKQKGGFAITSDRLRRQFHLGKAYSRIDNLTSKIIQPACQEMKDSFPVYFEFRLYSSSQYVVFKVKTRKTKTELQADFLMARDTTFSLLASVGASTSLLSELFAELDHEDLIPYLRKLSEITTYVQTQRGHSIKDINAYILSSITAWHTNWLSRYTLTE